VGAGRLGRELGRVALTTNGRSSVFGPTRCDATSGQEGQE
jgi:hypothetical protein